MWDPLSAALLKEVSQILLLPIFGMHEYIPTFPQSETKWLAWFMQGGGPYQLQMEFLPL